MCRKYGGYVYIEEKFLSYHVIIIVYSTSKSQRLGSLLTWHKKAIGAACCEKYI